MTARRPPRILVAEDDAEMRALLVEGLGRRGYAVDAVTSGVELLRRLATFLPDPTDAEPPSLLVTDVRMPGVGGLDAVAALRAFQHAMPVVVITAFGEPETLARARRLGAEVLEKPFALDDLARLISRSLPTHP